MPIYKLVLIVPCYNEEEILEISSKKLNTLFKKLISQKLITEDSQICFIDDGSIDKTWEIIESISKLSPFVQGLKLSENFGHQFAVLAGLETLYNEFDAYISIDADLQDDISVIKEMILHLSEGSMIVYGVRNNRETDSYFKRKTAEAFYTIMKKLGVKTIYNHADFRLIHNRVLKEFLRFRENNLFLRGIFPLIGFKCTTVHYSRGEREAGKSKYPLKKMISFAWEGITSFSSKPMRIILNVGIVTFIFSLLLTTWALVVYLQSKNIPGWFSIIIPVSIFGGLQMISLGIVGEYVGKIYNEIKSRPRYILEKDTRLSAKNDDKEPNLKNESK